MLVTCREGVANLDHAFVVKGNVVVLCDDEVLERSLSSLFCAASEVIKLLGSLGAKMRLG